MGKAFLDALNRSAQTGHSILDFFNLVCHVFGPCFGTLGQLAHFIRDNGKALASPARAASMAAFTAKSLVLSAISVMIERKDPISSDALDTECIDAAAESALLDAAWAKLVVSSTFAEILLIELSICVTAVAID